MGAAGSVREALGASVDALEAAGVDSPRLDAELLLCEATGWDRAKLATDPDAAVSADAGRSFGEMVRRRLRREPVAYIVGRRGFRRLELEVDARVLIPRPETELLVELALEAQPGTVLDVGTGSGAVALAIAAELPGCRLTATDTSGRALDVARANASRLGLEDRVEFLETVVPAPGSGGFDLAVANLPYVGERDWSGLEPEVTQWEPREALLGGADGLDILRAVIPAIADTAPVVALEVGEGQAPAVGQMLFEAGHGAVEVRNDLAGIERVVVGRREPGLVR